jgi:hypothetical protein
VWPLLGSGCHESSECFRRSGPSPKAVPESSRDRTIHAWLSSLFVTLASAACRAQPDNERGEGWPCAAISTSVWPTFKVSSAYVAAGQMRFSIMSSWLKVVLTGCVEIRVRHPALPLRHRHGYCRRQFTAASHPDLKDPDKSSPPRPAGRVRTAPQPLPAGFELVRLQEA